MEIENVDTLKKIESEFEQAKKIIEFFEQMSKKEQVSYDEHIERLLSLRFLYSKIFEWQTLKKVHLETEEPSEAASEPTEPTEDFEFDPIRMRNLSS